MYVGIVTKEVCTIMIVRSLYEMSNLINGKKQTQLHMYNIYIRAYIVRSTLWSSKE